MKRNVVILDHYRDQSPVKHAVNPWALAFLICGWLWAGIWFTCFLVCR